ncbi:MAG: anthranilate phosphoribosyltransferase [Candidatus Krumholzibacteriia bacterium]
MSSGRNSLVQLIAGESLSGEQAYALMTAVMAGEIPSAQLAGILVALRTKGETVDEITGFARAMRENATSVQPERTDLVDTCGTGGDGSGTFNISTATAIVAASMGCGVAKHGNRAVSSACGSADVLEHMGVDINLTAIQAAEMVDSIGLGFLFAPGLHPAMKHAMPARKELGIRTVFNVLGPLTNPAGARRQLLGVFEADLCETLAQVLNELGSEKAFVVHGEGGLDEVSLMGKTQIATLRDGAVTMSEFHPSEVGMEVCQPEDLKGGDVIKNAAIIEAVLSGESGPATDVVLLNAAFVAVLADLAPDVSAGVELARAKIADGSALRILDALKAAQT